MKEGNLFSYLKYNTKKNSRQEKNEYFIQEFEYIIQTLEFPTFKVYNDWD
jgi:hypothetical protein